MSKNGLILLTPTSIVYTGTSASISANGSVSFSAVTALELRGVFSADYDNYTIVMWSSSTGSDIGVDAQLLSGTTPASGSNYTYQNLYANNTSIVAGRLTTTSTRFAQTSSTQRSGTVGNLYGPFLAQPTAIRTLSVSGLSNAFLQDNASTHSLSTSYDGMKFVPTSGSISGRVAVYGMRK